MKTSEEIINTLHSITKLDIVDGELDTFIDNKNEPFGIGEFELDSFTRELLELIEFHMMKDNGEKR